MMIYVRYSLSLSFFLHTKCTYSSQQSMAVQIFAEDERAERLSSRREYSTNSRLVKTCCFNWTFRPSLVTLLHWWLFFVAQRLQKHLLCKAYFIFNSYINQVIYRSTMPPCHHATIALRSIRYPIAVLHRAGIDVVNGAE
jgi:hypothetical protein